MRRRPSRPPAARVARALCARSRVPDRPTLRRPRRLSLDGLADVVGRVGRLAAGVAVVHPHAADAAGGGQRALAQRWLPHADADERGVHRVADAVRPAVDVALDLGQPRLGVRGGHGARGLRQPREHQPAGAPHPLLVRRHPRVEPPAHGRRPRRERGQRVGDGIAAEVRRPPVELRRVDRRRIGDHRRQHSRVVVAAGPQRARERVVHPDALVQRAEARVAHAEQRALHAVPPVRPARRVAPERLELGEHLGCGHGIGSGVVGVGRHVRPPSLPC